LHSNDVLALLLMAATPFALALAGGYHTRHRRASRLLFAARLLLVGVAMSWMAIILSAAAAGGMARRARGLRPTLGHQGRPSAPYRLR
jgi:hypothetical protein